MVHYGILNWKNARGKLTGKYTLHILWYISVTKDALQIYHYLFTTNVPLFIHYKCSTISALQMYHYSALQMYHYLLLVKNLTVDNLNCRLFSNFGYFVL